MKKYILTLGIFFGLVGCSDDYYESLNVDNSNPSEVPAGFLVTYATTSLFHQMVNQNVNLNVFRFFSQYLTTTTYTDEPNYDLDTRNIPGNHWNRLYTRVLNNLKDARAIVEADLTTAPEKKANQLAIIDILEVYTYQVLVDTFGNVPYSEALMGLENQFPKYDDGAEIYNDLFARISADISALNPSFGAFGDNDIIYNDDISAWKKMAASLQLRMAVQVMDVNSSAAGYVQQALASGVFTSNDDNFQLNYLTAAPYTSPVYEDLVLSGRTDYVPANTVVDYMKALNDPRMPIYFSKLIDGEYVGGDYGTSNNYETHSHEGDIFFTPTLPGVLLDYAEVEFLQAEFYMKTGNAGAAKAHYEAGILANMDYWGVDSGDAAAYVAANSWDGANKAQLAMQFWIGMYNRGWEGWNVWRRLDSPVMNVAIDSGEPVPTRYTYPLSESSLNPDAYGQASSAIGGDTKTTKLFWDIH
ncbi:MAG: SusD/RagB family nutrient-binding outer membrane lipoprotein [Flavobacteriia bacterium]|nr:SusD/RagB family nutrient-binding outer membrane lipoprotein [Flavobacteriia bacterium]